MRLALTGASLLALATLAVAPAGAQSGGFNYAPGKQRYRLVTEVHRDQAQGGGRAPFEFDVTTTQFITLDIARQSRDTLRLTIVLDSVAVKSDLQAPPPDVKKLFGKQVTALISPQGRPYSFSPPPGNSDPQLAALYTAFRPFLLSFPTQPLAAGTSWTDSTTDRVSKDGFDIATKVITNSKVAGDTTVNGQRAWLVERRSLITQSGEKDEAGHPIHLTGEGRTTGVNLVSPDGVYLGSRSTQRLNIIMTMGQSESAPITQTIKSTVEKIGK